MARTKQKAIDKRSNIINNQRSQQPNKSMQGREMPIEKHTLLQLFFDRIREEQGQNEGKF